MLLFRLDLQERIGLAMKHAGVAITITSVTDLLAFGIGATSVLPALGSFCTYASIGIFSIYLNMASFFLAWLVIDQRRIDDRRDAIFCCWKKDENWTANKCSQKSYMDICFRLYSNIIELIPFKIFVLILSAGLFGISCYGVTQLKSTFDLIDWFPPGSSVVDYFREKDIHFPSGGISGKIYVVEVPKLEEKLEKLEILLLTIGEVPDLRENKIQSFLPPFFEYLTGLNVTDIKFSDKQFRRYLRNFLCTSGFGWTNDIHYVGAIQLNCRKMTETPEVRMITFGYRHKR